MDACSLGGRSKRFYAALELALGLVSSAGCSGGTATGPDAVDPGAGPEVRSGATAERAVAMPTVAFDVEVTRDEVRVDGTGQGVPKSDALERIDPLFENVRSRAGNAEEPRHYSLTAADDVPIVAVKNAFQTLAFAGWPSALSMEGANAVELRALVPLPPGASDDTDWPAMTLVILGYQDRTELWRWAADSADVPDGTETEAERKAAEASRAKRLGTFEVNASPAELREAFAAACREPCSPAILMLDDSLAFGKARELLSALSSASSVSPPVVQFRIHEPRQLERFGIRRVRIGGTTVSGRLPKEVIQETVRANYGNFRTCYEAGLVRNPKLESRVMLRFVIGRDGAVMEALDVGEMAAADEAVSNCVVAAMRKVQFPKPEGGIVTVVYPIQFSPDE